MSSRLDRQIETEKNLYWMLLIASLIMWTFFYALSINLSIFESIIIYKYISQFAKSKTTMPPLNRIKKIFKAFDFFSHRISFRYDDEPAYESVTGGVCSIIMIVVFIAIFTGTTVNTLNKVYINSSTKNIEDIDPSYYKMGTDTFMFAVGLTGINMN